ncbi:PTS transporter subunit EIIC, partial [Clostridium sp.]
MKDKEQIMDKVMLFAEKVKTNNYLSAISNGLMMLMPLLMIGSIALLLAVLPIDAWKQFLTDTGIRTYLMAASTLTTSLIALYASFTVAYCLAENLGQKAIGAGCISAFCFLIITPLANFETGSYLDIGWLGAKGLFGAMIVA